MADVRESKRIAGARNPKVFRVNIYLAEKTHERLEAVADHLGQNKGVTASMALSLGLTLLDRRPQEHYVPTHQEQVAYTKAFYDGDYIPPDKR